MFEGNKSRLYCPVLLVVIAFLLFAPCWAHPIKRSDPRPIALLLDQRKNEPSVQEQSAILSLDTDRLRQLLEDDKGRLFDKPLKLARRKRSPQQEEEAADAGQKAAPINVNNDDGPAGGLVKMSNPGTGTSGNADPNDDNRADEPSDQNGDSIPGDDDAGMEPAGDDKPPSGVNIDIDPETGDVNVFHEETGTNVNIDPEGTIQITREEDGGGVSSEEKGANSNEDNVDSTDDVVLIIEQDDDEEGDDGGYDDGGDE